MSHDAPFLRPTASDATLDQARELPETTVTSAAPPPTMDFGQRYERASLLGAGGMGEVHLCRDRTIGRDVAMKVIRPQGEVTPQGIGRFLREARVQGQLEHPAIVPVYDLGLDPSGAAFFTMKRVRGVGLDVVLKGLREGDPEITAKYSRRRLMAAFNSVCHAVHFAHSRSVLHRDLKPANVMLGDFGEVYVLDWGLAKVADLDEPDPSMAVDLSGSDQGFTVPGSVLGTPGYMSPEQIKGMVADLDPRTDVYALGAMLFEILTLEPLHKQATAIERVVSTLSGAEVKPSVRRPDREISPELDALCVRATATERDARIHSVGELSKAIEELLDGDRTLELRREAALTHASRAADALARANRPDGDEAFERKEAIQEVAIALGLDGSNTTALRTLVTLLTTTPREIPPDARAELEAATADIERTVVSWGLSACAPYALLLPMLGIMGIRHPWAIAFNALCVFGAAVTSHVATRRAQLSGVARVMIVLFSMLGIAASSQVFGPFVLTPMFAISHTIAVVFATGARHRLLSIVVGVVSFSAPWLAERLGLLPAHTFVRDGILAIEPAAVSLPPVSTEAYLVFANAFVIVVAALFSARFRNLLAASEKTRFLQAWQLRQAVPEGARTH